MSSPDSDRLDSWRQIAAYLKRDVRTVQRWERLEALPVHRSAGGVFAYRSELDRWRDRPRTPALDGDRKRPGPAAVLAATGFIALIAVSVWTMTAPETRPEPRTSRVWDGLNSDGFGAVSPDGRFASYIDPMTRDLVIRELGNGGVRRLTEAATAAPHAIALASAFSHDSTQIAYAWSGDGTSVELRVARLDGPGNRVVLRDAAWQSIRPVGWTSLGDEILCVLVPRQGPASLAFVRTSDGRTRAVKSFVFATPQGVSLSQDDRIIVYDLPIGAGQTASDLFAMNSDGTHDRAVTSHAANDVTPVWASDGETVVFASDRGGAPGLWAMSVSGNHAAEPWLLKAGMPITSVVAVARDGVVYARAEAPKTEIYSAVLDPRSGAVTETPVAIPGNFADFNIPSDWSPDGGSLVYRSRRSDTDPAFVLTLRTVATGEERQYLLAPGNARNPRWSPDSRSILFEAPTTEERASLYLLDLASGDAARILEREHPVGGFGATWSPDGRSVIFTSADATQQSIARLDLASRRSEVIYRPPSGGYAGDAAVSPDGQLVAIRMMSRATIFMTSLSLLSFTDGTARELTRFTGPETALGPVWTRDGRHLLFVKSAGRTPDIRELWRINIATGEMRPTGISANGMASIRLHPDGRRLAFSARGSQAEVWAIRNLPLAGTTRSWLSR